MKLDWTKHDIFEVVRNFFNNIKIIIKWQGFERFKISDCLRLLKLKSYSN
jgi:hypothetical protein